jgi:hypothetical protein
MARQLIQLRKSGSHSSLEASSGLQAQEREGHLQELMTTCANNAAGVLGTLMQGITALCTLDALLAGAVAVNALAALVVLAGISLLLAALRPFRSGIRRRSALAAGT